MLIAFDCYRKWLEFELEQKRKSNPSFSKTAFAKRLGVSQSFLSLVLSGRRNLSETQAQRLAERFELNSKERRYLLALCKRESARDQGSRAMFQSQVEGIKQEVGITDLSLELFSLMGDWQHSAVLEALQLDTTVGMPSEIAEQLAISSKEAVKVLGCLNRLGLVEKVGRRYKRVESKALFTPTDVKSPALRSFHKQVLELAKRALDQQNLEERNVSGVTMAIDPERIPEAKRRIQEFSKELMGFLEGGKKQRVYQLSIHLFELKHLKGEQ